MKNAGGLMPARSSMADIARIASIGTVSNMAISRQKFDLSSKYGPKFVPPGSRRRCVRKSKYEKAKNPDASRTCQIADVIATRFQKDRLLIARTLSQVRRW